MNTSFFAPQFARRSDKFFSPRDRALKYVTFDVDWFRTDTSVPEWLMPETLWTSRISALEAKLSRRSEPDEVVVGTTSFWEGSSGGDQLGTVYDCGVYGYDEGVDTAAGELGNKHLEGVGCESCFVLYPKNGAQRGELEERGQSEAPLRLSPWEIDVGLDPDSDDDGEKGIPVLSYPTLSEAVSSAITSIVNSVCEEDGADIFMNDVNREELPLYSSIVPVEVNLSLILARLESGYYTSTASVLGDVETMWENCDKFNKRSQAAWKIGRHLTGLLRDGIMEVIQNAEGGSSNKKRKIYDDDDDDEAEWDDEDEEDMSPVKVPKKRGWRNTFKESDDEDDEDEVVAASSRSRRPRRGSANYDDKPKTGQGATRRSGRRAAAGEKTKQNLFEEEEGSDYGEDDNDSEEFIEATDESEPESDPESSNDGRSRRRSSRKANTTSTTTSSGSSRASKRRAGKRKRSINGNESDSDDESNDGMTNAASRISAPKTRSPKVRVGLAVVLAPFLRH